MTPRSLWALVLALGLGTVVMSLAWSLWPRAMPASSHGGLLLPELSARLPSLSRVVVRGAGAAVVATLTRPDAQSPWQVAERQDWPANAGAVAALLDGLAKAQQREAKTRDVARHSRLGVEAIQAADAAGLEVCLGEGGEPLCVLLGDANPATGHRYLRRSEQAQVWLTDQTLDVPRTTEGWLDRRLIDRPLARIERVEFTPARGKAFHLSRVQDRFSLDGLPPVAMADPDRGNGSAAFLEALTFEDVAPDPRTAASQHARFLGVEGLDVAIDAWTAGNSTWLRCAPSLDEVRASAWLAKTKDSDIASIRAQFEQIRQRCAGHAFRLPAFKADNLMRSREQYLAD